MQQSGNSSENFVPSPAWQKHTMDRIRECGPHNITFLNPEIVWKAAGCAIACSVAFYVYIVSTDYVCLGNYIRSLQHSGTFEHLLQLSI